MVQDEENKAGNPTYLAAARPDNYRIPPKRLLPKQSPLPPRQRAEATFDVNNFFPGAVNSSAAPATTRPSSWEEPWTQMSWGEDEEELQSPQHDWKGGGKNKMTVDNGAQGEPEESQDDLLALLGITPTIKSKTPQKKVEAPEPPSRAISSAGSAGSRMEAAKPDNSKGNSRAPLCAICNEMSAKYICLPCRHWGPCTSCVPFAKDKEALYPECLRCEEPFVCLVRVYQH